MKLPWEKMSNLNNKQKIILGCIIFIMILVIGIYGYMQLQKNDYENIEEEYVENLNEDPVIEEEKASNTIVIHLDGEVKKPGIIELKEGERISDAVEKAGGLTEKASLKNINLAYKPEDGEKIYIPSKEEENEGTEISTSTRRKLKRKS